MESMRVRNACRHRLVPVRGLRLRCQPRQRSTRCPAARVAAARSSSAPRCSGPPASRGARGPRTTRRTWAGSRTCAKVSTSPASTWPTSDAGNVRVVRAAQREWTRIGRSLAADVRFDDPTVSRRHALIVRQARRRPRARRPQPQRRVRQRRAGRVEHAAATATRSSSAATRLRFVEVASDGDAHRRAVRGGAAGRQLTGLSADAPTLAKPAATMARDDRSPLAEGRHRQDDDGPDPDRRLPARSASSTGRRPRPAGQPVRLLRRPAGRRADDRRRPHRAAPRPTTRSHDDVIPANLQLAEAELALSGRWAAS